MCGRYVSPEQAAIEREWKLTRIRDQIKIPNWNVSPVLPKCPRSGASKRAPLKDQTAPGSSRCTGGGLIPFWAKGVAPRFGTIMATREPL